MGHCALDEEEPYAVGAFAQRPLHDWCVVYGFPREKTFATSAHPGAAAHALATEVARRGNYFYSLFLTGEPGEFFSYSADMVAAYPQSENWTAFILEAGLDAPRLVEVAELVPRLGNFLES